MKIFNLLVPIFFGATLVAAGSKVTPFIEAINAVGDKTRDLHDTIAQWGNRVIQDNQVFTISGELDEVVQQGIEKVKKAHGLQLLGASKLKGPTVKMMKTLHDTLTLLSDLHGKVDDAGMTETIRGLLTRQKAAAVDFNKAIGSKVPGITQGAVKKARGKITKWFDEALAVYST